MAFNLREARFRAKLTQDKISKATGIPTHALLAHETGSRALSGCALAEVQKYIARQQRELDDSTSNFTNSGKEEDDE